ncbi:MAG: O-antigen ligase family protein [Ignavibacteriaceae bacterium]|jgi:O-antigen ligase|nr:O-antigen ligase family protein [Ignavibacteriaceae bacterium]MCU0364191.1 O-antigen ligase family protein [Ignavibacteriaceae bacterium]MCU0406528.1 O-antigen ligase family protein [Ignavibacteriaceae bacterium]
MLQDLSQKLHEPINSTDLLIKINSFLLIYITFFTTKIPFDPANYSDIFAGETTDVKNQVVYLFLFFSSLIILYKRYDRISSLIKSEIYLSVFVLICLISAVWSEYPVLSIKRSFQLFVIFLVVVEALANIESSILLKQLKIVVSAYLFFNLYAGRFVPAATDPIFQTWRGIEIQKNHLAQTCIYCLLSSVIFFSFDKKLLQKLYDALLIFVSVFLIYKAHSSTAILVLAMILFVGFIFQIESIFSKFGFGRSLLTLIFLFLLGFILIFMIFSSEIFGLIPGYFGKDMTLSGRIPIWEHTWTEIEKRILLGYGFATYWIMGHPRLEIFAEYFEGFKVNQAHNGFLEIMLQLGVFGTIFFTILLVAYGYRMFKVNNNLAILIFVAILTLNYTESALFKVGFGVTTFYFITAYLALSLYYSKTNEVSMNEENYLSRYGSNKFKHFFKSSELT